MYIKSVHIENYKSYKGCFDISLNDGINILVGNNEAGKSTLIEAIHLALTGILNGRYLKNELSQYLFNNDIVNEYLDNLKNGRPASLPHILIELYIGGDDCPLFCGNANSHREDDCGLSYKITFDERYRDVYEELIKQDVKTLPIEYYDVVWTSFARDGSITSRNIPLKSALIDSSNTIRMGRMFIYPVSSKSVWNRKRSWILLRRTEKCRRCSWGKNLSEISTLD